MTLDMKLNLNKYQQAAEGYAELGHKNNRTVRLILSGVS